MFWGNIGILLSIVWFVGDTLVWLELVESIKSSEEKIQNLWMLRNFVSIISTFFLNPDIPKKVYFAVNFLENLDIWNILIITLGNTDHLCNNILKIYMEFGKINWKNRLILHKLLLHKKILYSKTHLQHEETLKQ